MSNYINVTFDKIDKKSNENFPIYITTSTKKFEIFSDKKNDKNCKNLSELYNECKKDHKNLIDLQCNKILKILNSFNCDKNI